MTSVSIQSNRISKPEFRGDIQGLRAIAVLGVILFHANRDWLPGGFVGVDIFFVISGFLIAGLILEKKAVNRFSFVDFYLARARRIVPAYFAMLAVVTFCAAILFIPKDFEVYWQSAKSAMIFGSNNYFAGFGDYFSPSSYELPLLHTWSLAIEMQFYLLLPALIIFLPERALGLLLLLLMTGLIVFGVVLLAQGDKKIAYFSLLVRIPEFLAGVSVALLERNQGKSTLLAIFAPFNSIMAFAGLALILFSFVLINEDKSFPGIFIVLPCLGASLVIIGHGGRVAQYLSARPLVWIGGLSYSLYLWHWPVFALVRYVYESYEIAFPLLLVLLLAITFLSYVSLHLIEQPCRNRIWFKGKGLARSLLLAVGVFVPIIFAQRVNAAVQEPLSIEFTRYADPSSICHGKLVDECLRGVAAPIQQPVLVLGDSHAAQLNLFFDQIGKKTGETYRVISASSCVTIPEFDVERIPEYSQKDCRASIELAQRFLPNAQQVVVAAMWQYHWQSDNFIRSFREFLSKSEASGKQVTVLWQVPMLTSNVQRQRRFKHLGLDSEIKVHSEWAAANQLISEIVAEYPNAKFLQLDQVELFAKAPFFGEMLVYSDSHHLNEVGATLYANHALKWFKK